MNTTRGWKSDGRPVPAPAPRRRIAAGARGIALALAAIAAAGCATHPFGPRAVSPARLGYNEAIGRSADEQLLLNIVRLRYRDNPVFLEVSSVVAQYGRSASASASVHLANPGGIDEGEAGIGAGMSENPVITLSPLRGKEFERRLMAPISGDELVALSFSGWSIERLMLCCVQEVGGLRNAISAAGPTPDLAPRFEPFQQVARILRHFQRADELSLSLGEAGGVVLDLGRVTAEDEQQLGELRRALRLPDGTTRFRLVTPSQKLGPEALPALGRSMLGVLYFLSQAVEVPPEHEQLGWVTVTRDRDGNRFDWQRVMGGIFRVHSGAEPPAGGALRVRYRGSWFWIADDDLDSKSTLSLVSLLLTLKSGDAGGPTPLIAISN